MPQDHQLTFDWILYAILVPPVLFALWELMKTWKFAAEDRRTIDRAYAASEASAARGVSSPAPPRGRDDPRS